jgi:hypothetical protein
LSDPLHRHIQRMIGVQMGEILRIETFLATGIGYQRRQGFIAPSRM